MSTAEYVVTVKNASAHSKNDDVALNDTVGTVIGCL